MKKYFIIGLLVIQAVVAGCTGSSGSYEHVNDSIVVSDKASFGDSEESINSVAGSSDFSGDSSSDSDSSSGADSSSSSDDSSAKINQEMLIYSCDVKIDTLDYDESVSTFRSRLKEINGFVEEEYYSDGVGSYGYFVEESEKSKEYTATVRVPSSKYDSFIAALGDLGDVRSQNATVKNVSQEYSDAVFV